jgi:hypothetical protein
MSDITEVRSVLDMPLHCRAAAGAEAQNVGNMLYGMGMSSDVPEVRSVLSVFLHCWAAART